jgi:hypothetical protein
MTYDELAGARGIDGQSARRMADRTRWHRQRDNHGVVRVFVPLQHAVRSRRHRDPPTGPPADVSTDTPAVMSADLSAVIKPLEVAVSALREQLEHANGRAQQAEKQVATAENRANQAENRASRAEEGALSERNRADLGEAGRDAAEIRANRAEQTLTAERNRRTSCAIGAMISTASWPMPRPG